MSYVDPYFAEIEGNALGLQDAADRRRKLSQRDVRRARGKVKPRRTR